MGIIMQGWNVRVTYEQADPIGEDQIGDVLEALEAHSAVASLRDRTASVALFVDTDTVMQAIDQAVRLVTDATAGTAGFVVVGIEAKTEEALHAENAEPLFPPLVGYAEIADMLGVTRQRVYQLARGKNFPPTHDRNPTGPPHARSSREELDQEPPLLTQGRPSRQHPIRNIHQKARATRLPAPHNGVIPQTPPNPPRMRQPNPPLCRHSDVGLERANP